MIPDLNLGGIMLKRKWIVLLSSLSLIFAVLACNMGVHKPAPTWANGLSSNTPIISIEPSLTETQAALSESSTPVPATNISSAPTITPTPQNPLVATTAYCWSGPTGTTLKYELVSSIPAGTRVQLLGKGIVDGWWIVRNPRYNDPCWIQQQYVQIDPAFDLSTLKTFAVPLTPTATP
jgi:hypothetical protein